MQKIDNIEIRNFKSILQAEIKDCRRVNIFIGYPNVGKSNILEALGLYSVTQQMNEERFSFNSICRFNHFSDLYFDKDVQKKINVVLNDTFSLSFNNRNSYSEFDININSVDELSSIFNTSVGEKSNFQSFSHINEKYKQAVVSRIKKYHFDSHIEEYKQKSTSLSIPSGDNLLDILHGNRMLTSVYSELLSYYKLKLNISDNQINVAKELSDGTLISFQNNLVSDTLRRLFFYKAAIQTNSNSILLFEEPEAHMFPPYIAKFIADVMFDKNNNQYFITTHSPFVLNDLMEDMDKEDLSIYIVGLKDGETVVRKITDEEITEIYQYGIDLFFNLENFLKDAV